jgi:pimeloyl-ACP methyl ester carboxylesterase
MAVTEELPQRLPHVSPSRLAMLRRLFASLQAVSTALAATVAFRLFLRTFRRPLRAEDAALLTRAVPHALAAGADRFVAHEWPASGRLAIVVHGWGSRAARFAPLCTALADRGWHVVAFDAPGHGASRGNSSSLPQFMAALDAVVARFGAPHALIGHSLGALAIASRNRDGPPAWAARLAAVTLVSMPSGAPFLVGSFLHFLGIGIATRQRLLDRFQRRFGAGPDQYTAQLGAAQITAPVLLVHDREDDIVPFAHSRQLSLQLPDCRLLATSGLGHSALTRDPDVIEAVADFLDDPSTKEAA